MLTIQEAQRRLIREGYVVDLKSPYRELTILNARYDDVKGFLLRNGYEGNILVIGEKKGGVQG